MARTKLQKILKAFAPDNTSVDFVEFDKEVNILKDKLKEKIQIKTLEDVSNQLDKFRKKINLEPFISAMDKLESSFKDKAQLLYDKIDQKTEELSQADKERVDGLRLDISDLQVQLTSLEIVHKKNIETLTGDIKSLKEFENQTYESLIVIQSRLDSLEEPEINNFQNDLDKLRLDLLGKISSIGGGSMNRQIFIGGVDPLTKFTDINLKAGANVTLTYANNSTTQKVDVTVSATGSTGIVRSVISISSDTSAGATSGTDYVYLVSGTTTLTLPTAVGNTNLYTIKNVGTGVVTIATTSAQTIDGTTTITMPIQYTSVDIISNSANWDIT